MKRVVSILTGAVYAAGVAYWAYRLAADCEPVQEALYRLRSEATMQLQYRAAVQRTLAAIRALPEVPSPGAPQGHRRPCPPEGRL